MMVNVLGETFSIKERKLKTQGKCFTKLKHKLKVIRIYYRLTVKGQEQVYSSCCYSVL